MIEAMIAKCHEYATEVYSYVMKVGSNIGPAAAGSAGPVPTPLTCMVSKVYEYYNPDVM